MDTFWLTRDEVRELDRRAIEGFGVPGIVLMENAGRGCAELLMRLNPERRPVVILCGPGNNGGDGFVIARHLDNHGWPVDIQVVAKHNRTRGDAEINFDILFPAEYTAERQNALTNRIRNAVEGGGGSDVQGFPSGGKWVVQRLSRRRS